jgi:hypothetical protein
MDSAEVEYILKYFLFLLDKEDGLLRKKFTYEQQSTYMDERRLEWIKRRLEVTDEELDDKNFPGFTNFHSDVAKFIKDKFPEEVFYNHCPKCNGIARTPWAKQCPHCFHSWYSKWFKLRHRIHCTIIKYT